MEVAVIIEGINESVIAMQPWIYYKDALAERNINIGIYKDSNEAFKKPFDIMLLHAWQDWRNKENFNPFRILPIMEYYSIYRAEFPETVQVILYHSDMTRCGYATPYWRTGDPILYRTPPYNREELYPFPREKIWAYERIWGEPCFRSNQSPKYAAGFIGQPNGPKGYRESVARETAKVGIGICGRPRPYSKQEYEKMMSECQIIVCPRGWGEQSRRHWDAWLSGKPVLTDRECDSVEMIPGIRLREAVHYLVFDDPKEIPDIVSQWTSRTRLDDLVHIAINGYKAASSYDALGRIAEFFNRALAGNNMC